MPVFSVIVLTFNSARHVGRCLRSLARQTLPDVEVIVVDAGSTDGTRAVVAAEAPAAVWIDLPGSDMGAARNAGLARARGAYLAFLDSDDLYLPDKLRVQAAEFDAHPEVDLTFCGAWQYRTGCEGRVGLSRGGDVVPDLRWFLAGHNLNLNTVALRRTVWERGFRFGEGDRGRYGEEWRLQLALSLAGLRMAAAGGPLVLVEMRDDSHTTWDRQWLMKDGAVAEVSAAFDSLPAARQEELGRTALVASLRRKAILGCLLAGRGERAQEHARQLPGASRLVAGLLVRLARLLPTRVCAAPIRALWRRRQDGLYAWQEPPAELRAAWDAVR